MRNLLVISLLLVFMAANAQSKIYILVFLHKKTDASQIVKDSVERLMKGHLTNIERMAKEGKLLAAGPFEGGGGLFILNTASKDEAGEWLKTDLAFRPTVGMSKCCSIHRRSVLSVRPKNPMKWLLMILSGSM
jgi:uncharacterized protein YciI